jgi:hypothetical protein
MSVHSADVGLPGFCLLIISRYPSRLLFSTPMFAKLLGLGMKKLESCLGRWENGEHIVPLSLTVSLPA